MSPILEKMWGVLLQGGRPPSATATSVSVKTNWRIQSAPTNQIRESRTGGSALATPSSQLSSYAPPTVSSSFRICASGQQDSSSRDRLLASEPRAWLPSCVSPPTLLSQPRIYVCDRQH